MLQTSYSYFVLLMEKKNGFDMSAHKYFEKKISY